MERLACSHRRRVIVASDRDAFVHAESNIKSLRPVNGGGYEAVGASELVVRTRVWARLNAWSGPRRG